MASSAPPATPQAAIHQGGAAIDSVAKGQPASHCSSTASHCTARAATSHSGATTTPEHGQRRDDQRDPRNGDGIGQQAHQRDLLEQQQTQRRERERDDPLLAKELPEQPRSAGPPDLRFSPGTEASVANSTPTATKLSQKPGLHQRPRVGRHHHGGRQQPHVRPRPAPAGEAQQATAASIHTVRCEGTPQPLKSA
jgi:hypothetical protein